MGVLMNSQAVYDLNRTKGFALKSMVRGLPGVSQNDQAKHYGSITSYNIKDQLWNINDQRLLAD